MSMSSFYSITPFSQTSLAPISGPALDENPVVATGATPIDTFNRVGDAAPAVAQVPVANASTGRGPLSLKASLWLHTLTHPGTSWLPITLWDNTDDMEVYLNNLDKNHPGWFSSLKTNDGARTKLVNKMRAHWGFDSKGWSETNYVERQVHEALGMEQPPRIGVLEVTTLNSRGNPLGT